MPHPEARVAAGCENGAALWREVRDLGYPGTAKQLHRWLQERRTAPARTTARRRRREARARAGGAASLLSPKRLAWALVRPPEALDAEETAAVARVGRRDPEAARVSGLARRFPGSYAPPAPGDAKGGDVAELDAWLAEARSSGVAAVETFAAGLEQDGTAVRAALTTPWSRGQAEARARSTASNS